MQNSSKREVGWITQAVGFIFIVVSLLGLMFVTSPKKGDVIKINCSISEISPDFTTDMRQACREALAK
jgi:hypothetical protein